MCVCVCVWLLGCACVCVFWGVCKCMCVHICVCVRVCVCVHGVRVCVCVYLCVHGVCMCVAQLQCACVFVRPYPSCLFLLMWLKVTGSKASFWISDYSEGERSHSTLALHQDTH